MPKRWNLLTNKEKYINLKKLTKIYDTRINIKKSEEPKANIKTKTIYTGKKLSILTTLHEIGHILNGSSEIKAIEFSLNEFGKIYDK